MKLSELFTPEFIPTYAMDRMEKCLACPQYRAGTKYICGPKIGASAKGLYCGCYLPKKLLMKSEKCPQNKW